jgi:hypothetical protein
MIVRLQCNRTLRRWLSRLRKPKAIRAASLMSRLPASVAVGGGQVVFSIGQTWSILVGAPTTSNTWRVKVSDLGTTFESVAMCLAAA